MKIFGATVFFLLLCYVTKNLVPAFLTGQIILLIVLTSALLVLIYLDTYIARVSIDFNRFHYLNWKGKTIVGLTITALYMYLNQYNWEFAPYSIYCSISIIKAILITLYIVNVITEIYICMVASYSSWEGRGNERNRNLKREYEEKKDYEEVQIAAREKRYSEELAEMRYNQYKNRMREY